MKMIFIIGLLIFASFWRSMDMQVPNNKPKHIDFEMTLDLISSSEKVFEFNNPDSTISHEMNLLRDTNTLAMLYYSDIQTPVCIDGLCKPVKIEVYWNLLGSYIGYGVYPDELLSKYDHEEFEEGDYLKLHNLLLDRHSILERKDMSSLYDLDRARKDTITFNGIRVDGVTGATKKEIKKSIVEGALYSCYKLWHIANGLASKKVKANISRIYNTDLETVFLESDIPEYHFFALQQMDSLSMIRHMSRIALLLNRGDPLLRSYILKKIPYSTFIQTSTVKELYKNIDQLDINSRTILLEKLKISDKLAFVLVSDQLEFLSKNQLKTFFEALNINKTYLNVDILKNVEKFADNGHSYSYLAEKFLQSKD